MPNLNRINKAAPAGLPCAPAGAEPLALPIPQAMAVTGLSRSAVYREAGRGNIKLLKLGRTTLVCMASARAFLASLPCASIRPPRRPGA
jgi:hypothetical protein